MFGSLGDAFNLPDLKRRLLFTLGILFIFRLGAHIPTPGVDTAAMANLFNSVEGGVMAFLNLFSGGALSQFSIFSLGVAPYINSSIVMQLLVVIFPALEKMQKDSADGRLCGRAGRGHDGLDRQPGYLFRLSGGRLHDRHHPHGRVSGGDVAG